MHICNIELLVVFYRSKGFKEVLHIIFISVRTQTTNKYSANLRYKNFKNANYKEVMEQSIYAMLSLTYT